MRIVFLIDDIECPRGQFELEIASAVYRYVHRENVDFAILTNRHSEPKVNDDFELIVYNSKIDRTKAILSELIKGKFDHFYLFNAKDVPIGRTLKWIPKLDTCMNLIVKSDADIGGCQFQVVEPNFADIDSALRQVDGILVTNENLKIVVSSRYPEVNLDKLQRFQLLRKLKSKIPKRDFSNRLELVFPLENPDITCLDFITSLKEDLVNRRWMFSNQNVNSIKLKVLISISRKLNYIESWIQSVTEQNPSFEVEVSTIDGQIDYREINAVPGVIPILLQDNWFTNRISLLFAQSFRPFLFYKDLMLGSVIRAEVVSDFEFHTVQDLTEKLGRIAKRKELVPEISPRLLERAVAKASRRNEAERVDLRYYIYHPVARTDLRLTLNSLVKKKIPIKSIYVLCRENSTWTQESICKTVSGFGLSKDQVLLQFSDQNINDDHAHLFVPSGAEWLKLHSEVQNFIYSLSKDEIHFFSCFIENTVVRPGIRGWQSLSAQGSQGRLSFALRSQSNLNQFLSPNGTLQFVCSFFSGMYLSSSMEPVIKCSRRMLDPIEQTLEFYDDTSQARLLGAEFVRNFLLAEYQKLRGQ